MIEMALWTCFFFHLLILMLAFHKCLSQCFLINSEFPTKDHNRGPHRIIVPTSNVHLLLGQPYICCNIFMLLGHVHCSEGKFYDFLGLLPIPKLKLYVYLHSNEFSYSTLIYIIPRNSDRILTWKSRGNRWILA